MNTSLIMGLPVWPIWIVDLLGSALMILFSFLCVRLARRIRRHDQDNVVWTYLLWVCYALAGFAVSRSVGHIAKRVLLSVDYPQLWAFLQPYSGAINSLMFVVVAAITLFFERIWNIYQQILGDKQALQEAHTKLLFMNRNLENLVTARTQELSVSERKNRRIFEASQDMILVASPQGQVVDLNKAGVQLLGLDQSPEGVNTVDLRRGDTVTRRRGDCESAAAPCTCVSLSSRLSPKSTAMPEGVGGIRLQEFLPDQQEWQSLARIFREQGYVANREVRLKRRDGAMLHVLLSGTATCDEASGEMESIHFLVKDISRRKAMERQLLQADKLASIGQLAAGIAHEINNPLGVILGYAQLLMRGEKPGDDRHHDLKVIEKHAQTCKSIVGDLLSFSRSSQTRKELGNLHAAVEEVIQVIHHHMKTDRARILCDYDERVPLLVLDKERIKQVLMNLLMNAKHAVGDHGTIRLSTSYDEAARQVRVSVSDDGYGIDLENLSRVFDPFFTTKSTGEGTGLGLSVSYGIVRDHGGDILVTSEPGKGSTFTVLLPAPAEDVDTRS
jgi:two-component system NtrC family sensor kinase